MIDILKSQVTNDGHIVSYEVDTTAEKDSINVSVLRSSSKCYVRDTKQIFTLGYDGTLKVWKEM